MNTHKENKEECNCEGMIKTKGAVHTRDHCYWQNPDFKEPPHLPSKIEPSVIAGLTLDLTKQDIVINHIIDYLAWKESLENNMKSGK